MFAVAERQIEETGLDELGFVPCRLKEVESLSPISRGNEDVDVGKRAEGRVTVE
jgi:hypothetical protein